MKPKIVKKKKKKEGINKKQKCLEENVINHLSVKLESHREYRIYLKGINDEFIMSICYPIQKRDGF